MAQDEGPKCPVDPRIRRPLAVPGLDRRMCAPASCCDSGLAGEASAPASYAGVFLPLRLIPAATALLVPGEAGGSLLRVHCLFLAAVGGGAALQRATGAQAFAS